MTKILKEILNWSEVWATLIPLAIFLWYKPKAKWVKPLIVYLLLALLLNLIADFTWKSNRFGLKEWSKKFFWWLYHDTGQGKRLYTVILYNINSFIRLLLITWFFYKVNPGFRKIYIILTALFVAGVGINFVFFENILLSFSSRLFTVEAAIILFYCLLYHYTTNMNDKIISPIALPETWVVMALTLYTSINFLIFLFFNYLIMEQEKYAISVWNVHNLSYIVLMIIMGASLKKTGKMKP